MDWISVGCWFIFGSVVVEHWFSFVWIGAVVVQFWFSGGSGWFSCGLSFSFGRNNVVGFRFGSALVQCMVACVFSVGSALWGLIVG